ncbi:hypothetical protein BEP19_11115 [Ammoniphilus oxalaticus]|uniref:NERD domain-containing protein n=1 Tax=Ammoniphilus oxalaticus TaxID=66863 RepID=A0A419SG86_9BACL|nr:nuclease-related domain-containing protein [Ammoniphilus oxalaticus]RKD22790.1 hypothetical protein BEP19_11115 [Ammoniphilus oxalaticus]
MIRKPLNLPLQVQVEEALLRRLSPRHKKRPEITARLQKGWAGYVGEQQLAYHLNFLSEQEYDLFFDLRLVANKKMCQLDALIVSPHALFVVESKNFLGELLYDQHTRRFIRKYQNQETSFPDPIMQLNRQRAVLTDWLRTQRISIPIAGLVLIGNSTSMLKTNEGSNDIYRQMLFAEQIPDQIPDQIRHITQAQYKQKVLTPYKL